MATGDLHILRDFDAGKMTIEREVLAGAIGTITFAGKEYTIVDATVRIPVGPDEVQIDWSKLTPIPGQPGGYIKADDAGSAPDGGK